MAKINCLNPIAACGMDLFNDTYEVVDDFAAADAVLVRSAAMHDLELAAIAMITSPRITLLSLECGMQFQSHLDTLRSHLHLGLRREMRGCMHFRRQL